MESPPPETSELAAPEPVAWYRWHWATWIVTAVVGAALVYPQVAGEMISICGGMTSTITSASYGWPLTHAFSNQVESFDFASGAPTISPATWQIDAWSLARNIIAWVTLLAGTVCVVETWARSAFRWQFGLKHLLALTLATIGFVLVARGHIPGLQEEDLWNSPPILRSGDFAKWVRWPLVFALGCTLFALAWSALAVLGLVFTAASRPPNGSGDATPEPPESSSWHRWHWVTWIVTIVVGAAMIYRQCEVGFAEFVELQPYWGLLVDGWPFFHGDWIGNGEVVQDDNGGFTWFRLANLLISFTLVACTTAVCEAWARAGFRLQFGLRNLLALTGVCCVLFALTHEWTIPWVRSWGSAEIRWSFLAWSDFTNPLRWPILIALGCAIYLVGAGAIRFANPPAAICVRPSLQRHDACEAAERKPIPHTLERIAFSGTNSSID